MHADADADAGPRRGDLLEHLQVDLVRLAAAAVAPRGRAGTAARPARACGRRRAGTRPRARASATCGRSSLPTMSRVSAIRSADSWVGISLLAGMAPPVSGGWGGAAALCGATAHPRPRPSRHPGTPVAGYQKTGPLPSSPGAQRAPSGPTARRPHGQCSVRVTGVARRMLTWRPSSRNPRARATRREAWGAPAIAGAGRRRSPGQRPPTRRRGPGRGRAPRRRSARSGAQCRAASPGSPRRRRPGHARGPRRPAW